MKALRFIKVSIDTGSMNAGLGRFRACCSSGENEKQLTVAGAALDLFLSMDSKLTRFPFNPVPARLSVKDGDALTQGPKTVGALYL